MNLKEIIIEKNSHLALIMSDGNRCPGDYIEELNHINKDKTCALQIAVDKEHCVKCWLENLED